MSDYKPTNYVVQANDLIRYANWKMDKTPLKIFKLIVSCVDTENPSSKIKVSKHELHTFINGKKSFNYTHLKKQVESLQGQILKFKKEGFTRSITLLITVDYPDNPHENDIVFQFHDELKPFLIEMSGLFTKYQIEDIKPFKSKYGVILYEYLVSERFKTQDPNKNYLTHEELLQITGTKDKKSYQRWYEFKTSVLDKGIADINNSELGITATYQDVKNSRGDILGARFNLVEHGQVKPKKSNVKRIPAAKNEPPEPLEMTPEEREEMIARIDRGLTFSSTEINPNQMTLENID